MNLADLTFEDAKAMEGTVFLIALPDGRSVPLKLDEARRYEFGGSPAQRGVKPPKRAPFSLYFLGPVAPLLSQGLYTFCWEGEISQNLFIVPVGQDEEATEYEAVFN